MSPSVVERSSRDDTEIALALCSLGSDCPSPKTMDFYTETSRTPSPDMMSLNQLADVACSSIPFPPGGSSSHVVSPPPLPPPSLIPTQLPPFISHFPVLAPPPPKTTTSKQTTPKTSASPQAPIRKASHLDISARRAKKADMKHRAANSAAATAAAKRSKHEDTSVTFEEMQRLMNVYGPIKCLRNRSNKQSGREIKAASILRKFYRWFPDFEERFVKVPETGCYVPKIGHEKEIKYREMMRTRDEMFVISKRNLRRYSLEVVGDPMDGHFGMSKSH